MTRRRRISLSAVLLFSVLLPISPGFGLRAQSKGERKSSAASARARRKARAKAAGGMAASLVPRRRRFRGKAPSEAEALEALAKLRAFQEKARSLLRSKGRGRRRRGRVRAAELEKLMSLEERKAASRTVLRAYTAAGRGRYDRLVRAVDALRPEYSWDFSRPLRVDVHPIPLLLVSIDQYKALRIPPERMVPFKAADRFPGPVPSTAPRVRASVEIDPSVPRWHSTGLYAPPGGPVKVTFPKGIPPGRYTVIVGCHTDSVARRPAWARFPRISRSFPVKRGGTMTVGNVFGGLLYVAVRRAEPRGERFRVVFSGAVRAPFFVLGKTGLGEWRKTLRNAPAPFGEIAGRKMILSLPSRVLRSLDDPGRVARFWDRVVAAQDDLAAYPRRAYPERFVFDRQISVGYMHSGYPLMGPVSAAPRAVDVKTLTEKGNWGMFHEIGHNHQLLHFGSYANPWTFDGTVEVTVNIFASYTYVAVLKKPKRMGHAHWRTDLLPEYMRKDYSGPGTSYPERSYREKCLFWVHLIEEFGWDTLKKVFAEYAGLPRKAWPRSNLAKRSLLLEIYSRCAGRNLVPLFEGWGLETAPEARKKVEGLPPWKPKVPFPGKV